MPSGPSAPAPPARFDPGAPGVLDAVAVGPPAPGLAAGAPAASDFRDVYYDSEQGDLEWGGAWACIRHHADGSRTLAVRTAFPQQGGRIVMAELPGGDADALFSGDSEPARTLRAMIDPSRLVAGVEVRTRRITRPYETEEGDRGEAACDALVVRDGDLRAEVEEIVVTPISGDAERLETALRHAHGMRPVTEDRLARARQAIRERELDLLEDGVRAARRVAVVAVEGGRLALHRERTSLRVPAGQGTGEEAARRVVRSCFGADGARLRLLGTAPGSGERPAVEVWLAEGATVAEEDAGCEIVRLPLDEVLSAIGSPALRDRETLAALHVLARTDLPEAPVDSGSPDEEARARGTLASADADGAAARRLLPPGALLNMELSVLAFNRRVLGLAEDDRVPLLERLRFLAIFGGNLDEFFRVRVAGFKRQVSQGSRKRTMDGVDPQEQLDAIGVRVRRLWDRAYGLLYDTLLPALRDRGIEVVHPQGMTAEEAAFVRETYVRDIHPILMPMTAGPGRPFPPIRNLRPALVALVGDSAAGGRRLGMVELPDGLPRFVRLPGGRRFVAMEEVVRANYPALFPELEVDTPCAFRVTRSAELHLDAALAQDLLHAVEEQVRKRRFRPVVRMEVERAMPAEVRAMLLRELQYEAPERVSALGEADVYEVAGMIDLRGVRELADVDGDAGEGMHYPPSAPAASPLDASRPVIDQLRERDVLVSFPGDSFEATVERLVIEAAEDPSVVAVKLALYRTNPRSRIVEALTRAAAHGKQVVALVELTARFDELSNIHWARYLRSFGIHVIYGVPGLKVHAKIALVVRREEDAIRQYAYIGTGNLNASTATFYTDLGLMTANPGIAGDLNEVFNALTGGGAPGAFRQLLVAPFTLRRRFVEMIDREAEHARAGRPASIRAKFNGLADREMIAALYRASQAGVSIDLLVRGICSLRPGVAGLSETIRVYSLLGRHLEHERIFRFENGGDADYYIGSADWRTRNLSRRIEVAVPVRDPDHRLRLDAILDANLARPELWELGADGTYYQRPDAAPREPAPLVSSEDPDDGERRPILTSDG